VIRNPGVPAPRRPARRASFGSGASGRGKGCGKRGSQHKTIHFFHGSLLSKKSNDNLPYGRLRCILNAGNTGGLSGFIVPVLFLRRTDAGRGQPCSKPSRAFPLAALLFFHYRLIRDNISEKEEQRLKKTAKKIFALSDEKLNTMKKNGELVEI
jgi:hypothetical protein